MENWKKTTIVGLVTIIAVLCVFQAGCYEQKKVSCYMYPDQIETVAKAVGQPFHTYSFSPECVDFQVTVGLMKRIPVPVGKSSVPSQSVSPIVGVQVEAPAVVKPQCKNTSLDECFEMFGCPVVARNARETGPQPGKWYVEYMAINDTEDCIGFATRQVECILSGGESNYTSQGLTEKIDCWKSDFIKRGLALISTDDVLGADMFTYGERQDYAPRYMGLVEFLNSARAYGKVLVELIPVENQKELYRRGVREGFDGWKKMEDADAKDWARDDLCSAILADEALYIYLSGAGALTKDQFSELKCGKEESPN